MHTALMILAHLGVYLGIGLLFALFVCKFEHTSRDSEGKYGYWAGTGGGLFELILLWPIMVLIVPIEQFLSSKVCKNWSFNNFRKWLRNEKSSRIEA